MKFVRLCSICFLLSLAVASVAASALAHGSAGAQDRGAILVAPCAQHLLGTDDLGRDMLLRTLYGSAISLLVAPTAALITTLLALLIGGAAGVFGGVVKTSLHRVIDLFLSVPWIFLLLIVRAMLPLNVPPSISIATTVFVLGAFGWAASARVISESVAGLLGSAFIRQSIAQGIGQPRRYLRQVLPNLRHILLGQLWIAIPVFIVGEANLGLLGLGVGEPIPSWGNLLRQLENFDRVAGHPWLLAPLFVIVLVLGALQITASSRPKQIL